MANKLMIFDDDKDILFICTFVFEKLGWQVTSSENCIDIASKVKKAMPHVILMDNWIPDEGGIVATRILKDDNDLKHIPVVYFSANRDVEALSQQACADAFIKKPFDIKELEDIVTKYAGMSV